MAEDPRPQRGLGLPHLRPGRAAAARSRFREGAAGPARRDRGKPRQDGREETRGASDRRQPIRERGMAEELVRAPLGELRNALIMALARAGLPLGVVDRVVCQVLARFRWRQDEPQRTPDEDLRARRRRRILELRRHGLTVSEIARIAGVSRTTVYAHLRDGETIS
ncbi:MAG TPA: ArsR family transcriptional regulator [Thiotrichales bacterium]|nr:ArsR family transcriptional regulator [Thiotrichales bacterium]